MEFGFLCLGRYVLAAYKISVEIWRLYIHTHTHTFTYIYTYIYQERKDFIYTYIYLYIYLSMERSTEYFHILSIYIRREDKNRSQDLGASSTEKVIKPIILDNITQGEGTE